MTQFTYQLTVFDDSPLYEAGDNLHKDLIDYFKNDLEVQYLLAQGYGYTINRVGVHSYTSMIYELVIDVLDLDLTYLALIDQAHTRINTLAPRRQVDNIDPSLRQHIFPLFTQDNAKTQNYTGSH